MGNGELPLNEYRVSTWDDEKVLKIEREMIANIFNATELYTYLNGFK